MTNDVAIKRKLIFQGITFGLWALILWYSVSDFIGLKSDIFTTSMIILPLLIIVGICKIIRTAVYIHGTYNSDVEFENYKHTKKALPAKHKIINSVTLVLSFAICFGILAWSGFTALFLEEKYTDDIKSLTLSEYSNFDEMNAESKWHFTSAVGSFSAVYCENDVEYELANLTNKDGLAFEDGTIANKCEYLKNCPQWVIDKMYEMDVSFLNQSQSIEMGEATLCEINTDGVTGFYELYNSCSTVTIVARSDNDLIFIRLGSYEDGIIVDYEKLVDFAVEWLKNN